MEGTSCIVEENLLPLKRNNHIWMPIVPTLYKTQRHRNQARVRTIQMRPKVDFCIAVLLEIEFGYPPAYSFLGGRSI
jgi:hypothetical protein